MLQNVCHSCIRIHFSTLLAGLEEIMQSMGTQSPRLDILARINQFDLVNVTHHGDGSLLRNEVTLGRQSHPIDIVRKTVRTIGFDRHIAPILVQTVDQRIGQLQRRFATRNHHEGTHSAGYATYFAANFILRHLAIGLKVRIAERATEVATGEADEYSRRAGMETFALQAEENLIDPHVSLARR